MTKIGVGVGEDFPIKDQNCEDKNAAGAAAGEAPGPAGSAPEGGYDSGYGPCGWGRGPDESYEDWRARRDAWRRQRREWRQQRREWRHRFKADMRAFRHEMRARYRGQGYGRRFPVAPLVVAAVVLSLLLTGFFTVIFNAPVLVLGVVLLAVLYAAHRHYGPLHDYDYTPPPSGPNGAPPAQGH